MNFPKAILTNHSAFLGKTGSGKTSTAKLLIEQVVAEGARVCVIDPIKSDWWGLTSSADGKRPGLPFQILGGPRGHLPLHAAAGKAIGEVVASGALRLSILDMADFGMGEHVRFFHDFGETLFRKMRGVVYLVVEEAHTFAPKEKFGNENQSIYTFKRLATGGRSKGIRLVVATQRTQELHNAVLGSCETVFAHRLTAPADQEPVVKWLKANTPKDVASEVAKSLSSLSDGQAWLCSGNAQLFSRMQFPRISTFDNSATPTGELAELHIKTAPVDQDALRALIGDAVKEAEANDPKKLRAEIGELRRQLSARAPAADPAEMTELRARNEKMGRALQDAERNYDELVQRCDRIRKYVIDNTLEVPPPPARVAMEAIRPRPAVTRSQATDSVVPAAAAVKAGPQDRVLSAAAWWASVGVDRPSIDQLAAIALYHPRSKGFTNTLGALRSAGLLDGTLITDMGRGRAKVPDRAPTLDELHAAFRGRMKPVQARIFDEVRNAGGSVDRDALAAALGYHPRSKGFCNSLGSLRTLGLLDYREGAVVGTALMYPEALL